MWSSSAAASDRASTYTFSWAAAVRCMHSWGSCSSGGRAVHLAIRRLSVCIPDSPGCISKYSPKPILHYMSYFFYFSCSGEWWDFVFLWSSINVLWTTKTSSDFPSAWRWGFFTSGWTCPLKHISGLWVAMQFPQRPEGQIRLDPTCRKSEFLE